MLFGTAGVPISSRARDTASGVARIKELGLGCMEIEFVRGVKMGESTAREVRKVAEKEKVALSVHAPYFINLNSNEKAAASAQRIKDSARIGALCGAGDIVFHAAYYQKNSKERTYQIVKKQLEEILQWLDARKIKVRLRPETTGRKMQFGTLEEIIKLSSELENVLPCVDFSHIHARTRAYNSYEEFSEILAEIEEGLGREALKNMQVHVSGIEYGHAGEKRHLNLGESDFKYRELLKAFKDFKAEGAVICESPNLEEDALLLREEYKTGGIL
ncbi:MAG: TIM barrel protein [Euryarchaeota archaeon]|nr:TIM barrel protein [Euryarchaeota archaeon]